jgi:hypothetical protein
MFMVYQSHADGPVHASWDGLGSSMEDQTLHIRVMNGVYYNFSFEQIRTEGIETLIARVMHDNKDIGVTSSPESVHAILVDVFHAFVDDVRREYMPPMDPITGGLASTAFVTFFGFVFAFIIACVAGVVAIYKHVRNTLNRKQPPAPPVSVEITQTLNTTQQAEERYSFVVHNNGRSVIHECLVAFIDAVSDTNVIHNHILLLRRHRNEALDRINRLGRTVHLIHHADEFVIRTCAEYDAAIAELERYVTKHTT